MSKSFDVIVIGLGSMGSTAIYQLAKRGQRVLGLERFGPAHDQGSHHGGSRIIRQAYFEDPAYVPLLLRAYELWEQIERESGADIMTITGGLMMGKPDSMTLRGSLESAKRWNLPYEMLDAKEIKSRFPAFNPTPDLVGLYEANGGFVRPEASVYTHLCQAERHGAELHFHEAVTAWEAAPYGEGVRVTTEKGVYEAGRLIVCPGAWAPDVLADLGVSFAVERGLMMWFEPVNGLEPFRIGKHPIYIWEDDGAHLYGFPAQGLSCEGVKIGGFYAGTPCTTDTIDRQVHDHEIEEMRGYIRDRFPALNGKFIRAKTCFFTFTADQHFVVSPHPRHPQVAIAAGFSGHGFKFASVVGEILADLTTVGTTSHPIELFRPERLMT
ncbi:N-methyl-L-tryptophan oxidase [Brevibacillus sp. B_LB10_24]|uniref:N-methyl-L-tryptophan oxidase n=1 Tax=Brevibacillus sp. B_LB10_24 TaxID=3380645 RepID=UPI0038BAE8E5